MIFIYGKPGDDEICLGYDAGENVDFLDEYYMLCEPTGYGNDKYWGIYCKYGYLPYIINDGSDGFVGISPDHGKQVPVVVDDDELVIQ